MWTEPNCGISLTRPVLKRLKTRPVTDDDQTVQMGIPNLKPRRKRLLRLNCHPTVPVGHQAMFATARLLYGSNCNTQNIHSSAHGACLEAKDVRPCATVAS